ncbi:MAG: hypothetical protein ACTSRY_04900, partial [Alphaproteobacteria bacterium]
AMTVAENTRSVGGYLGCNLPRNTSLDEGGWEWRCNADPRRTGEMVESYRALGFEVRTEPVDAELLCAECGGCKDAFEGFNAVYVRKP